MDSYYTWERGCFDAPAPCSVTAARGRGRQCPPVVGWFWAMAAVLGLAAIAAGRR